MPHEQSRTSEHTLTCNMQHATYNMQHTRTHARTTFAIHIRSRICCKSPTKATTIYGGRFFFICCQHRLNWGKREQGGQEGEGRVEGTCIFHELVHIKVKCTKRKRATEGQRVQDGAPVGSVKAQFKVGKGQGGGAWATVRHAGQTKHAA